MFKLFIIAWIIFIIMISAILVCIPDTVEAKNDHIKPQGAPLPTDDYVVTAKYHDPDYYSYFHEWHTGIDMIPSQSWYNKHQNQEVILHSTITGKAYRYSEKCSGNAVIVANENYSIYLGHVSSFLYKDGDEIKFGDNVGIMGQSGELGKCVTGPHVHYQIYKRLKGKWSIIDPSDYLN